MENIYSYFNGESDIFSIWVCGFIVDSAFSTHWRMTSWDIAIFLLWLCKQHNFFLSLLNLLNHSVWTIFLTQISFWLLHGDTLWETCSCCLQKEYFALLKLKAYLLLLAQQLHYNDLCPLAAPWMAVHYLLLFFWFSIMYKTEILLYKPSISSSLQIMIKLMSKCSHLPL